MDYGLRRRREGWKNTNERIGEQRIKTAKQA
jgi:hypothetical protein